MTEMVTLKQLAGGEGKPPRRCQTQAIQLQFARCAGLTCMLNSSGSSDIG